MPAEIHFAAVILAAGESSRMGTDKAMLAWPPPQPGTGEPSRHTLLSASIATLQPCVQTTIVVGGRNTENIRTTVAAYGAKLVRNPHPENGQFSSLQMALRAVLELDCNAAIITPVDCPPLRISSVQLLRDAFLNAVAGDIWAVAPENGGKHGHPLLANRDLIEEFLKAPVASNARAILYAHLSRILYVPVPDSLAKAGLNTPRDYALHGIESLSDPG